MNRRDFVILLSGAAVAVPLAARAQQPGKVYRIAIIAVAGSIEGMTEAKSPLRWRPFFEELRRLGYVEGQNLTVERYSGKGQTDRYAELARTVAASNPDAMYCITGRMAMHCKAATITIPIVAISSDPVPLGLLRSLSHPGGNITGVVSDAGLELEGKGFELLRQAVPTASRIAYLSPRESRLLVPATEAAKQLGVVLIPALVDAPHQAPEYRRAFAAIVQDQADALVVGRGGENSSQRQLIIDLAEQNRMPTIYPHRDYTEEGGLISYGPDPRELQRRAASNMAQILGGTNPAEIPVYQPTRLELVINMKTAKALSLTIPQILLARADEVIE